MREDQLYPSTIFDFSHGKFCSETPLFCPKLLGKSTTVGHLFYKHVDFDEIENESRKFQEGSSKFAGVFDRLVRERNVGSTGGNSLRSFDSPKFRFNIIDTSGQPDSIEDTILGMSQADVGLLVVDATIGGDESDIDSYGITKEHCLLAYTLGVKQMIIAINFKTLIFSEDHWKKIRSDIASHLKKVGYKPMKIPFIPISGLQGDNLDSKSMNMPWYGGSNLSEALNNVTCPKRPASKPLRVPIQGILDLEGIGKVLVGRVESGVLQTGMNVQIAPSGVIGTVESLHVNHRCIDETLPGDIVHIHLKEEIGLMNINRGHVLSNYDDRPARQVSSFEAQFIVMNYPGKIPNGYNATFYCHTSHMSCVIIMIKAKLDPRSGKLLEENPESVEAGDVCLVEVKPSGPFCIEQFKDFPALGRFAVRDFGQTVGVGVVKTIFHADENRK